jgi:hypothetical protein
MAEVDDGAVILHEDRGEAKDVVSGFSLPRAQLLAYLGDNLDCVVALVGSYKKI